MLRLEQLGLRIQLAELTLLDIQKYLETNNPVVAFVNTADFPYWGTDTDHAVVVIGLDNENVQLNDPFHAATTQVVSRNSFQLAQLRFNQLCAVIEK